MRILSLFFLMVLASSSAWAQFYSYRDENGKLVITDRPVRKKGFKLVGKYVPKRVRDEQARRESRRYNRGNGKFYLTKEQVDDLIVPIARNYSVDIDLVRAVIVIESSRDVKALSHKGAMGLMQLIPETAERFGVKDPYDPKQNVRGGIKYLQYLLSYFEGDVDLVLAGYNAGENAVDKYGGIPPYKETRNYVRKIRRMYDVKKLPYGNVAKNRSHIVRKRGAALEREERKGD